MFYQKMDEAIDTSKKLEEDGQEAKCHIAIILNMSEVLKDKVQQISNKLGPMVESYQ